MKATLYAASGEAPSHCSGVVSGESPTRFSEKDNTPGIGWKKGPFHHSLLKGTAWVFHQRTHALSSGSTRSCGTPVAIRPASGQVTRTARRTYKRKAPSPPRRVALRRSSPAVALGRLSSGSVTAGSLTGSAIRDIG